MTTDPKHLVAEWWKHWVDTDGQTLTGAAAELEDDVRAFAARVRQAALEEAAAVVSTHEVECPRFCCSCAAAGRVGALKSSTTEEG